MRVRDVVRLIESDGCRENLSKRAKHRDAGMTSILVKRFKMGQIDVEDLEQMAADTIRPERCLATKKVLIALRDSPDLSGSPESHSSPYPLLQNAKSEVSNHIQHLHAQFLGLRLPDLIRHPGRSALGLFHLQPFAREYVHLLRAPLSQLDFFVAPVGRLQSCLARQSAWEKLPNV